MVFCFRTCIVDDLSELKNISVCRFNRTRDTIYGEIELQIGMFSIEMLFAPEVLGMPPQGREDIGQWLEDFLKLLQCLMLGSGAAAFRMLDLNLLWIVAEKTEDSVQISIARDGSVVEHNGICDFTNALSQRFYTIVPSALIPERGMACRVPLYDLRDIVVSVANRFLEDIKAINPILTETLLYSRIEKYCALLG